MSLLNFRSIAATSALVWALAAPPAAHAQATYSFNLPAQDLGQSLRSVARQTGSNIAFDPAVVRGRTAPALRGNFSAEQALERLLDGSGLSTSRTSGGSWVVARAGDATAAVEAPAIGGEADEVVITGSRIRGATSPSPVTEVTAEQVRDAGFSDLGQVIRSLPQNFSGGQNPGVQLGAGGINNQNMSSGSALNLRGLGQDATLTLLNGRRLSYNGFTQAVDVSAIPIGALARIEVVADGASAIYGSDAVAGVANIILRRDYDGASTTARIGIPTDGGGEEYQLSATAGTTWGSGGFIAAYEYTDAEAIFSDQRSYTAYMPDPASIYPSRRQHSVVLSAHQDLGDVVEFNVDGLYTRRSSTALISTQPTQRVIQSYRAEIFTVAPRLDIALPGDWSVTLGGTYGRDETVSRFRSFRLTGALARESLRCYCNTSYSAEISGEGPLFQLPGGDVRAAIGAGYRRNDFDSISYTGGSRESGQRSSRYAFGELYLPLIGPATDIPAVNRLTVTAALRYEDYPALGSVTTPKLGLIYEPTPDLSIRGSWGRSFKAPTLLQEFSEPILYLWDAGDLGGTGYPPGSTVLMTEGGNRNLRPERAETWSATLSVHPRALSGLQLDLTYFDVDYRDRVVQPVSAIERTFDDPAYREFLTLNPSDALKAQIIAASPGGITNNFAGAPYDPAQVVGIVSNVYTNVARSAVRGVDASASYRFSLGGGTARISGSATWLEGSQQSSSGSPEFQTVGIIANPPEFSARGGIVWNRGGVTLATFVNHLAGVIDNNQTPEVRTDSFTTVDANLRYRTEPGRSLFANVEVGLSVLNLFDQSPPRITPIVDFIVNYDSTNYSGIGRVVSLSVTKHW